MRSIDPMTTPTRIRASDAERERVATRIQHASAEGRLTLDETEQRLGAVYAAAYRDELAGFVDDLPPEKARRDRFPPPLRLHAALVMLVSAVLVLRWVASDSPFFWPVVPVFWLGLSLVVHAGIRARRPPVPY
jgi:hypothetical protein